MEIVTRWLVGLSREVRRRRVKKEEGETVVIQRVKRYENGKSYTMALRELQILLGKLNCPSHTLVQT